MACSPRPVSLDRIQLSPGERAEIVVAMTPGETVELRNYSPDFGGRVAGNSRFGTGDYRVLELRAAPDAARVAGGTRDPRPVLPDPRVRGR